MCLLLQGQLLRQEAGDIFLYDRFLWRNEAPFCRGNHGDVQKRFYPGEIELFQDGRLQLYDQRCVHTRILRVDISSCS